MSVEPPPPMDALFQCWDRLRRPIWMFDPLTRRGVYANAAALTLWGAATREELLARDFSNLSPAVAARTERLMRATADGSEISEQWTFYPNGAPVTVQATISAFPMDNGALVLLFEASPVEVEPAERRAIEALRHTSAPISLFNAAGDRLFANPASWAAYGDGQGFVGHFASPEDGEALLAAALSGGESSGVREMLTAEGLRWHLVEARTVLDPVTGDVGVLLNEQDVTARVAAETARATAEQKAAMAEARQRFLTDMSHELRTPLNAVLGFSSLLIEAGLDAGLRDHAQRIHGAGERLAEVVEHMIGLSQEDDWTGEVRAPQSTLAPAAAPETASEDVDDGRPMRVLYVDDNDNNRTLISTLLSLQGVICETANDGAQGLAAASRGGWDVILMDIQMPVMDGVEATRRIRALDAEASAVPIIAVTANTLDDQLLTYAEAGMNDCIGKPVNPPELFAGLMQWADTPWRETWRADRAEAAAA